MARMKPYFRSLLRKYEVAPLASRKGLYQRLKENASTFAEWTMVHKYGDNAEQYEAEQKMRELVLIGDTPKDIQMNIMELFEVVTDVDKQNEVLKRYFDSHHENQDDLLFVLVACHGGDLFADASAKALKYYKTYRGMQRGIDGKRNRLMKWLSHSKFLN